MIPFPHIVKSCLNLDTVEELKFHPKRRWRFDFAIPSKMIAVEVEGGAWIGGRHTRGAGFVKDLEKYNEALRLGWKVIRVTPQQLRTEYTLQLIKELI